MIKVLLNELNWRTVLSYYFGEAVARMTKTEAKDLYGGDDSFKIVWIKESSTKKVQ